MSSNIILFVVNNIIYGINDITNDIHEYFNYKVGVQALKRMVFSILLDIAMVKFLKTLHTVFNVKKLIFQIKLLNEINFFLKVNYILIQFKMFIYS